MVGSRNVVLVLVAVAACMPSSSSGGFGGGPGGGGGGGGPPAPPPAPFYCNGEGVCFPDEPACTAPAPPGPFDLAPAFGSPPPTECWAAGEAWCAGADRSGCRRSEADCAQAAGGASCERFVGLPRPPSVVALLGVSGADPTPRAIVCRYAGDALVPAAAAGLCPPSRAEFREARLDIGADWTLYVLFDEPLGGNIATSACQGQGCRPELNAGIVTMNCDEASVYPRGGYEPTGAPATGVAAPTMIIRPSQTPTVTADTSCMIELSDWVVDRTGDRLPDDQRRLYFHFADPARPSAPPPPPAP